MPQPTEAPNETRRRTFRRRVLLGYFVLVVLAVGVLAAEICYQALRRQTAGAPVPGSCVASIQVLSQALDRARATVAANALPEDEAVRSFRQQLEPAWSGFDATEQLCASDPPLRVTLDALRHLRYAEESAVRSESSELTPLRKRARELLERHVHAAPPTL